MILIRIPVTIECPLYVREHTKNVIHDAIWNDTDFLSKMNVMDYSLLVGIEENNEQLVLGIVDYIRTFTWDKKLEWWVKDSGILGGGGEKPTVISPEEYKVRFRQALDKYFLLVPDCYSKLSEQSIVVP